MTMEITKQKNRNGILKVSVFIFLFLFIALTPALADRFRSITSGIFNYYFDETFRLDSEEVFLVRILPKFSMKAEVGRADLPDGRYSHSFGLGPIINVTDNFYMDSVYALTINSNKEFAHKIDINFTQETDESVISFGVRYHLYLANDYYYLPSISGAITPLPQLRLFSKLFFSWDQDEKVSGSLWSEARWSFTPLFAAQAGFTISYTDAFGYSIITGFTFSFTRKISLKYFFQYLSNTVVYGDAPEEKNGIGNGLIFDIRF
jgi:hypothetical protein